MNFEHPTLVPDLNITLRQDDTADNTADDDDVLADWPTGTGSGQSASEASRRRRKLYLCLLLQKLTKGMFINAYKCYI